MVGLLAPYVKLADVGDWQSIPDMDALPKHPKEKENRITENIIPSYKIQKSAADDESTLKRDLAITGVSTAAPMAGFIGESPISDLKDAYINRERNMHIKDLSRMAQPGDVVLISHRHGLGGPWQAPQAFGEGNEFYHVEPVVARKDGHGVTLTAGEKFDSRLNYDKPPPMKHYLRKASPIHTKLRGYDVMLMRPKKPLSPEQLKKLEYAYRQRLTQEFDSLRVPLNWLRDVYLPKRHLNNCAGKMSKRDICATMPSQAHYEATGRRVVPDKHPAHVMPVDYIRRNSNFDMVASSIKGKASLNPSNRTAAKIMTRAGLGLGLAGATVGTLHDPAVLGVPVGGLAALSLTNKILRAAGEVPSKSRSGIIPDIMQLGGALGHGGTKNHIIKQRFLTRSLPVIALGGVGGYLGAAKLRDLIREKLENRS